MKAWKNYKRNRQYIFANVFILALFLIFVSDKQQTSIQNTPPAVKIISPANKSAFLRNKMISYDISVSDKEDGESRFQEIASNEIFLGVKYFPVASKATAYLQQKGQTDPVGFSAIKKSDCFNCHSFKGKLIGPSMEEISKRYSRTSINYAKLATNIKKGSTGVWGTAVMPAHPELSDNEAKSMVAWIMANASDPTVNYYRGAQGAFWCKPATKTSGGVYVLTASYTDHGLNGNAKFSIKGEDRIIISEKK